MCIHIGQETTMTLLLSGKLWAPHNSYTTLVEANIRSIHCHRSLTKEEKEAITVLYELEIATGYNNNFMPKKLASREEAAKMFDIFIDYLVGSEADLQ